MQKFCFVAAIFPCWFSSNMKFVMTSVCVCNGQGAYNVSHKFRAREIYYGHIQTHCQKPVSGMQLRRVITECMSIMIVPSQSSLFH